MYLYVVCVCRYIYLWIFYAVYEELHAKDILRARDVYKRCLDVIPHLNFTFGKIWILSAQLEVRQKDLPAARKILGRGIGMLYATISYYDVFRPFILSNYVFDD